MRIGLLLHRFGRVDLTEVIAAARSAAEVGLAGVWLTDPYGLDALTALAVAGREVPDVELGTAVVPTPACHPLRLAGQVLTTQAAVGGRLMLGIGASHQVVAEEVFGSPYRHPLRAGVDVGALTGASGVDGDSWPPRSGSSLPSSSQPDRQVG